MDEHGVWLWKCTGCDWLTADEPHEKVYECGSCGTVFTRANSYDGDGNRCPDCRKFSSVLGENACPDCESAGMEQVLGFECPECNELWEDAAEFKEHLAECGKVGEGEQEIQNGNKD